MANSVICADAIRWALKNTSYKNFTEILRECQHFRNIISRGGFKLNGGTFRENNTVQRLVVKICSDPDFARMVMIYNGQGNEHFFGIGECFQALDKKWLRANWREVLRAMKDPRPMVLAFLADNSCTGLRRIGEIIAGQKRFWRDDTPESPNNEKIRKRIRTRIVCRALSFLEPKHFDTTNAAPQPETKAETQVAPTPASAAILPQPSAGILPLIPPTPAAAPIAPEPPPPAKTPVENTRVGDLKREMAAMRKQAKADAEKAAEELKEKNKQIAALQKRLDEIDATFNGALSELSNEKDRQVDNAVALFEQDTFGINPDSKLFAQSIAEKNVSLDERVNRAIKRQEDCNLKNGSNTKLRKQRDRLSGYLKKIAEVLDDAIIADPELLAVQKEIDAQLGQINEKLRESSIIISRDYEIFPDRLLCYIRGIRVDNLDDAEKKFDQVQSWLDGALPPDVLSDAERKELTAELQQRRKYVRKLRYRQNEAARREEARAAALAKGDINPDGVLLPIPGAFSIPQITEFKSHLPKLKNIELYIDAYNVIKRDPVWSQMEQEVSGFKRAREDFSRRVKNIAHHFKHVTVVFDSEMIAETSDQPNRYMTVIWAPKHNTDQNADNYIVNRLIDLANAESEDDTTADEYKNRWVITEDFKLVARLDDADCCGAYVSNGALTALLRA